MNIILWTLICLLLASCDYKSDGASVFIVNSSNLDTFRRSCKQLGECMDAIKVEVVHFEKNQTFPYACSIEVKSVTDKAKIFRMQRYFYPSANHIWDNFEFDHLEGNINTCELIKHKGEYSLENIKAMEEWIRNKHEDENKRDKKTLVERLPPVKDRI